MRALCRLGLQRFFGIPGGAISPIVDALIDEPAARVLLTRHETEAVFAAAGHYLAGGGPAVVFVTSGPGLTNTLTGLASARCDGVPLVLLVGEVPRAMQGHGALQDGSAHHLDVVTAARCFAKAAWPVAGPASLPALIRSAVQVATSDRPGPVVLTLPLDVQSAMTIDAEVAVAPTRPPAVDEATLDAVARALGRPRRAAVLVGAGMRRGDGPPALRRFAERWQLPVITSPKGKGAFPESHPLHRGVFGIGGHPSARALLEDGLDTLLVIGTSLGDLSTDGFSPLLAPKEKLVHVDLDGGILGRHYETHLGVVAEGAAFLRDLSARAPQVRPPAPRGGLVRHTDPAVATDGAEGRVSPARAIWELQRVLPAGTLFTIDSGEHYLYAAHYLHADEPEGFIAQSGLGSMGASLGAAIGAQLARPDRAVAAILGDGGFGMAGTQIADAAAASLPIVFCVINDQRLAMCELGHRVVYGRSPDFATPNVDVVAAAEAFGARGLRIEHTGDILRHADVIAARSGPLVLDVRVDRSFSLPKRDRIGAMGQRTNHEEV